MQNKSTTSPAPTQNEQNTRLTLTAMHQGQRVTIRIRGLRAYAYHSDVNRTSRIPLADAEKLMSAIVSSYCFTDKAPVHEC